MPDRIIITLTTAAGKPARVGTTSIERAALTLAFLAANMGDQGSDGETVELSVFVNCREVGAALWSAATACGGTYAAFFDQLAHHAQPIARAA